MKNATREFLVRRDVPISVAFLVVAVFTSLALPKNYEKYVLGGVIFVVGTFIAWTRVPSAPPLKNPQIGPSIREHFERTRTRYLRGIFILFVLVSAATSVVWPERADRWKLFLVGFPAAMAIGLFGGLMQLRASRCPQCGTNFRSERKEKLGAAWRTDPRGVEELWDSCPHCHVSFDAPYSRQPMN